MQGKDFEPRSKTEQVLPEQELRKEVEERLILWLGLIELNAPFIRSSGENPHGKYKLMLATDLVSYDIECSFNQKGEGSLMAWSLSDGKKRLLKMSPFTKNNKRDPIIDYVPGEKKKEIGEQRVNNALNEEKRMFGEFSKALDPIGPIRNSSKVLVFNVNFERVLKTN